MRTTDIIGRWGGDEFVAVLRHVDCASLHQLAERCCVLVAQTSFLDNNGNRVSLSVSVGGALVVSDDTCEALIRRADEFMYRSKSGGRNRVSVG